jgi:hypothetical protein
MTIVPNVSIPGTSQSEGSKMTKSERTELCALTRQREKLAKTAAAERAAELLADFEAQLARIYHFDDEPIWQASHEIARKALENTNAAIAARCEELGIPEEFAPALAMGWRGRNENSVKSRRDELRKVAVTHIAAMQKSAHTKIETHSVQLQSEIVANGLTSEVAKSFLERMPAIASLMPPLDAQALLNTAITRG